ncbi:MAG: hypothetical protein HC849_07390 [Oscillatoriales cyanobacterium RU_3_3]|nr:hypothetical protein [Microcoleus sp. SU_5_6]NJM60038.1 hypothetical protein [Oscillatoriales cyanobacterium RU_3_3]
MTDRRCWHAIANLLNLKSFKSSCDRKSQQSPILYVKLQSQISKIATPSIKLRSPVSKISNLKNRKSHISNLKSLLSGSIACQPVLRLTIPKTTVKADPTIALGTKFAALANIPNRSPSRSVPLSGISMLS